MDKITFLRDKLQQILELKKKNVYVNSKQLAKSRELKLKILKKS